MKNVIAYPIGAVVVIAAVILTDGKHHHSASSAAQQQQQSGMPVYCSEVGSQRLPECGWNSQKETKRLADERADDKAMDALGQYIQQQLAAECDRPIAKMTPNEIEDCQSPAARLLPR